MVNGIKLCCVERDIRVSKMTEVKKKEVIHFDGWLSPFFLCVCVCFFLCLYLPSCFLDHFRMKLISFNFILYKIKEFSSEETKIPNLTSGKEGRKYVRKRRKEVRQEGSTSGGKYVRREVSQERKEGSTSMTMTDAIFFVNFDQVHQPCW